jgi:hypothetical protein
MSSQSYSGDVTVDSHTDDAVEVVGPENVHLVSGGVDGDIKIVDPEYVFLAAEEDTESVSIDTVGETIEGSIEDIYTEPESVTGDLRIESATDVFVEPGAATGAIEVTGHEQLFADIGEHSVGRGNAGTVLTGWERSTTVTDPTAPLGITGGRCQLSVEQLQTDIDVFVTGWKNSVEITGRDCTVTLHLLGSHNAVTVGPYVSVTRGIDASLETTLTTEDIPYADIIETTKDEALNTAGFGRRKLVYQTPAPQEDYCPSCGASSDRVIERKQLDAFFLFGRPVYTFERGESAYECDECSMNAHPEVTLSEEERKELLR